MPVAHRHEALGVDSHLEQASLQGASLLLGKAPNGRSATDHRIMMLYFARPGTRNQFGKRFTAEAGEREIDDIGIAEKVIKKRLNRLQRVRSAKLEENYTHLPC